MPLSSTLMRSPPLLLACGLLLGLPARASAPAPVGASSLVPAASCPDKPSALAEVLAAADAAWESTNRAVFERNAAIAAACFASASRPVSPQDAAGYLRLRGLVEVRAGRMDQAALYFRGAAAADPAYRLPENMVPPGNPVRVLYEQAAAVPVPPGTPLPSQPKVALYVNGAEADTYPADRPVWIQTVVSPAGVVENRLLTPGEPFELAGNALVGFALDERARREQVSRRMAWSSGALALAALALEGTALLLQGSADAELESLSYGARVDPYVSAQRRAVVVQGAAIGTAGMALCAAGAAVMVRF